jgi:hypothetical protein
VFFASVEHGGPVATGVLVGGYIVMRVALIGQWLRAAAQVRAAGHHHPR